jgi:poly-gamma-glutamate synthesis protein (capsule biosynthesis protein)
MVAEPVDHVRAVAPAVLEAGATLVAGHSAHVFHGARGAILYDLGDFLDDYRVDAELRNDLSALWLVELDAAGPRRIEAVPLALDYCRTRLAAASEIDLVTRMLAARCAAVGGAAAREGGRVVISTV